MSKVKYKVIPAEKGWHVVHYHLESGTVEFVPIVAWIVEVRADEDDSAVGGGTFCAYPVTPCDVSGFHEERFVSSPEGRIYEQEGEIWNSLAEFVTAMKERDRKVS